MRLDILTESSNFAGGIVDRDHPLHVHRGADGTAPEAGVTIGAGGVLYGTALGGVGYGSVFSLTPPESDGGTWTFSTLHSFTGGADGTVPSGALVMDGQGVLYGTTFEGGGSNHGAVFSLTPPSSPEGEWTETVIYGFTGGDGGSSPEGLLARTGPAGQTVLYGAAGYGREGGGFAYSLTAPSEPGGSWTEAVLYSASGTDELAAGPLVQGNDGVLYGSTFVGGARHNGSIFALEPPASAGASWTFRAVYNFPKDPDAPSGDEPYMGEILAVSADGSIYGTTYGGGPFNFGTVFSLRP